MQRQFKLGLRIAGAPGSPIPGAPGSPIPGAPGSPIPGAPASSRHSFAAQTLNVLITGSFIYGAVGVASVCSTPAFAVEPLHGRVEHMERSRNGKTQEGEVASDAEAAANAQFDLAIQMATDAHLPANAKFSNYITMRSMLADFMVGKRRVVVMGPRISSPLQCRYFRLNPSTTKNWRGKYNPEWCKVKLQSTERGYYFTCAENPDGPRGWFLRVETPDGEKQRYAIFLDQPPQTL